MINSLEKARKEINQIDKEMARLFEERMACVKVVAEYKKENNLPILDEQREAEIIKSNSELVKDEAIKEFYVNFLKSNMSISKAYQAKLMSEDKDC